MANPHFPSSNDDFSSNSDSTPRRLYNPYEHIQIPHLPSNLQYSVSTSPEFLFQEEALAQRRSWGENLTYFTGIGYLGGAISGGAMGLRRAFKETEPGDSKKIRINRILNSCGQDGRRVGNRLGVIGLLYAGIESGVVAARGEDDWINTVVAGLGTGALFRAANGPRSAVVAGMVGGVVAGAAVVGKQFAKRYVPI